MSDRQSYFREKQIKIDAQFDASRKTESNIFAGVVAAVDGFTGDLTALEIKQILSRHGGNYAQYVFSPGLTHLIATNLPTAKIRKELSVKRRTPLAIVTPQWIIDCLKAKRQLPWGDYTLAQLHAPDQTTLNSWRQNASTSRPSSSSSSMAASTTAAASDSADNSLEISFQALLRLSENVVVLDAMRREGGELPIIVLDATETVVVAYSNSISSAFPETRIGLPFPSESTTGALRLVRFEASSAQELSKAFCDSIRSVLLGACDESIKFGFEMLNSQDFLISSNGRDREKVFETFEKVKTALDHELQRADVAKFCEVTLDIFGEPLDCWRSRSLEEGSKSFMFLPCVPTCLGSKYADMSVEDASVALIECDGLRERQLRQICSGQMWRKVPSVAELVDDQQTGVIMKSLLTVHELVTQPLSPSVTPDTICEKLIKRLLLRPAAAEFLKRSSAVSSSSASSQPSGKGFLLTVTCGSHRFSAVSTGRDEDLHGETLALIRQLTAALSTTSSEPLAIRLDVSEASNVNPHSFSQISPQTLKMLPREVVHELRSAFGRSLSSSPEGDNGKPLMPDSYSQLDVDILRELPPEIRREVEDSIRRKGGEVAEVQGGVDKPAMPRSISQIDSRVLEELPLEIRLAVQRELREQQNVPAAPEQRGKKKKRRAADDDQVNPIDETSRASWPETFSQVDPDTLQELPPDIALEVEQAFKFRRKAELEKKHKEQLFSFAAERTKRIRGDKESEIIDLTSPPINRSMAMLQSLNDRKADDEDASDKALIYEPFARVRETVISWMNSLSPCPHQDDSFEKCCQAYMDALFEAKELDKVDMLMSLLRRLCTEKQCAAHDSPDCWIFAFQDLKRHVLRMYRQKFNSHLVLSTC